MEINTQLPESGDGFVTNNRGANGEFQFGQQASIEAAIAVAAIWGGVHSERPLSIGQISKKGGGEFPPHLSHRLGVDIDVRPMRTDGANEPVTIDEAQYDRALTTELIDLWWENAPVQAVFFNDPTVIAAKLSQFVKGHGNHFHVRLRMKGATLQFGNRGSDVKQVQGKLGIKVDGHFGLDTLHAVEKFQADHGLTAHGVVGPQTLAALGL